MISITVLRNNMIPLLSVKYAKSMTCLVAVSLLAMSAQSETPRTWSRTFSWADHKNGPAIILFDLDQSDIRLTGWFAFENYSGKDQAAKKLIIEGCKTSDGVFWPDVRLEVRNESTEKWRTIGNAATQGCRDRIAIEPNTVNYELTVNLEAFKPLIRKYTFGRIVLKAGQVSEFELKNLLPPNRENDK